MDITVYLPDEIGQRAKDAGLPLSRMLRRAVLDELGRLDALGTGGDMEVVELDIEGSTGDYRARFVGREIAPAVYLHQDGRVLWYDEGACGIHEIDDPVEGLRDVIPREADYIEAVATLGLTPVVEI